MSPSPPPPSPQPVGLLSRWRSQAGFNLIEILVTLSIMAVGFLGLAKLQAESMRNATNALFRSKAIFLIEGIMENMRANKNEATSTSSYITAIGTVVSSSVNCAGLTACSTSQMAQYDLSQWKTNLSNSLPSGDGAITRNGTIFTITVRWDESRGGGTFTQFAMTGEL